MREAALEESKANVLAFIRSAEPMTRGQIFSNSPDGGWFIDAALSHLVAENKIELAADQKYRAL